MVRHRGASEIIVEMLKVAKDGVHKTKIMNEVGLTYSQFNKYLEALKKVGFISQNNEIWSTT